MGYIEESEKRGSKFFENSIATFRTYLKEQGWDETRIKRIMQNLVALELEELNKKDK